MRWVLVQDMNELSVHYQKIKDFVDNEQPKYSSHVIDALIEWFDNFRSDEDSTFAIKRGINFLGRKSTLISLFFILVYQGSKLIAFIPLFRFKVHFGSVPNSYEVVAFCPDSTLFFYNDILVKSGLETSALHTIFGFIKQYNRSTPYIILFNHMPSTSSNLPLLLKHSLDLSPDGFNVGISPVYWRGGLYPWNLVNLQTILIEAASDNRLSDTTRNNIQAAINEINAANKTMLVFKKNHLHLKSKIYRIFGEEKSSDILFDLYNAVESVFRSHPVKYPFLTLPESTEIFLASLSSSKRYYYKRYRKQFVANNGNFEKLHGNSIDDRDINDFIALHRERWGNNSNILSKTTSPFILSFLQKLASSGLLTLFFASYQSERIACLCCIDFKERREFLSSGRSLKDEKLRAGKLLLFDTIIDSINEGFKLFDFGYGDEAYKSDYNWSYITNNTIAVFHNLLPEQCPNLLPMYEELLL